MDVSIIIVNYNTKDLTFDCLKSIYEQTKDISFEVIVSDNGSTDGSIEMITKEFPQVTLIENNANLGFGAANNRGLNIANGKYIFYLNSDTVLLNNAVKIFFDYWEGAEDKEQLGALGSYLINNEYDVIHSWAPYPTLRIVYKTLLTDCISASFGQYAHLFKKRKKNNFLKEDKEICGYITGADLFLLNNDSARFDETFFMYFEETDLQLNNIYKKSLKTILLKEPMIVHFKGGSDRSKIKKYDFSKKSSEYYWSSCLKYLEKNKVGKSSFLKIILSMVFKFYCSSDTSLFFIKK